VGHSRRRLPMPEQEGGEPRGAASRRLFAGHERRDVAVAKTEEHRERGREPVARLMDATTLPHDKRQSAISIAGTSARAR
jgi:hypothetical protein